MRASSFRSTELGGSQQLVSRLDMGISPKPYIIGVIKGETRSSH